MIHRKSQIESFWMVPGKLEGFFCSAFVCVSWNMELWDLWVLKRRAVCHLWQAKFLKIMNRSNLCLPFSLSAPQLPAETCLAGTWRKVHYIHRIWGILWFSSSSCQWSQVPNFLSATSGKSSQSQESANGARTRLSHCVQIMCSPQPAFLPTFREGQQIYLS